MFSDLIQRIKLLFLKDKELYYNVKSITGCLPHNIDLYKLALSHKSIMAHDEQGKLINNERLEFLGDAILGAVTGDIVFRHFPRKREGFLTTTRSKLVQREMLGKLAKEMGVTDLLLSSSSSNPSHNSYIGGNAFEALVGALYLDKGYYACMKFVEKRILSSLVNIDKVAYKEVNFKSKMLEWAQKKHANVTFELCSQSQDAECNPTFEYLVKIENIAGGRGKGYTKKESQQIAARKTLEKLRRDGRFTDTVYTAIRKRHDNLVEEKTPVPQRRRGGKAVENDNSNKQENSGKE